MTSAAGGGYFIVNIHETAITQLTVNKEWNDSDNLAGKRPAAVDVVLYANGESVKEVQLTEANEWTHTFENLPKFTNGELITYTVAERSVPDYSVAYKSDEIEPTTVTITNFYTPETVSVPVHKIWMDGDDQDGVRPVSVQIQLLADKQPVEGKTLNLSEENNWSGIFDDLPKYVNGEHGKLIQYSVEEIGGTPDQNGASEVSETTGLVSVKDLGYTDSYVARADGGFIIINTHDPKLIDIETVKTWEDDNDNDNKRPESIHLILYADDTVHSVVEVKPSGLNREWKHTFTDLPKYKDKGQEIQYRVVESKVDEYSVLPAVVKGEEGMNGKEKQTVSLVNTHNKELTAIPVYKVWDDADNQDGKRPEEIVVTLFVDGVETEVTRTLNAENDWTAVFTDLPVYKTVETTTEDGETVSETGVAIEYTVEETEVSEYVSKMKRTEDGGFMFTNTYEPETVDIEGSKVWDDNNNQDGARPSLIRVTLLADGKPVRQAIVMEEDNWSWSFENMPKYDDGKEIVYTVTENSMDNYEMEIDGYDIINHYTPGKTAIPVTKTWIDGNNARGIRPESVTVELVRNGINTGRTLTLSNMNYWTGIFNNLDLYEDGERINWTVREFAVSGYTSIISGSVQQGFIVTNILSAPDRPNTGGSSDSSTTNNYYNTTNNDGTSNNSGTAYRPDTGSSSGGSSTTNNYYSTTNNTTNSGGTATRPETGGYPTTTTESNPARTAVKASTAANTSLWFWSVLTMVAAMILSVLFLMRKKPEAGKE